MSVRRSNEGCRGAALDVRCVEHGSAAYAELVELRAEVLRRPLGFAFAEAELAAEAGQLHFAGYADGRPVACAVLQWVAPGVARMRQVAVRSGFRGRGLGRKLVEAFEREARERGAGKIVLHARQTAVAFYLKLGYAAVGDVFEEIGLLHRRMEKSL
jgi:ribosomal protein S18 acetylase RimI-like enzyme